jgi:4-hydroxy-2-oxoglutarate aldolase
MLKLNGIFPPLPTSFDFEENLSTHKMKENIQKLSEFDLAGFLVLGSNGELVNLSDDEKVKVYSDCREAIPEGKLMLAGTGCQSTKQTIKLTNEAASAGADAALVLNPSYYKGLMTKEALKTHYFKVADHSKVPVIIYNMPANSGLDMDAETIITLSAHENIIGLKDSGGNLTKMGEIRKKVKSSFQILAGSAGFLVPALSIGAVGGILAFANIAPDQCINIYEMHRNGNMNNASENQLKIIPFNNEVTRKQGVPALKEAMDQLGLYGGPSRKPLQPVDNEIKEEISRLINTNNLEYLG